VSEKRRGRKPGIALLGVADTYIDAMMWKDMLDQQGIPSMVRDGNATVGELGGGLTGEGALPGPGHMEVYVPSSALQRAKVILGPSLTPVPWKPTPASTAVSATWLAWILVPILFAGFAGLVVLALRLL
jgi:hypothetical protein